MDPLLQIGLANALMAGVMAAGAALVGRFLRGSPALRHGLWLLVLLKLIAPPLWPVRVPWPAAPEARGAAGDEAARPPAAEVTPVVEAVAVPAEVVVSAEVVVPTEDVAGFVASRPDWGPEAAEAVEPKFALPGPRTAFAAAWAAGSLLWVVGAAVRLRRFRRALRSAKPASEGLQDQVDELAARLELGRPPEVWLVPGTVSPFVWGLGRSVRLIVPIELWSRLDAEQRSTLLIHELAHLRRRDHWVRVLELVATGLYWWHPAVWWARRALRDAEEQCCDAWVVWARPDAAKSYATALLETVDFLSETRPKLPLAASGIGHVEHLKRRLTMIVRGMTPRGLSWAGRLTVLGLAGAFLPLAPTSAQDPKPDEPREVRVEVRTEIPAVVSDVIPEAGFIERVVKVDDDDDDEDKEKGDKDRDRARKERDEKRAREKRARDEEHQRATTETREADAKAKAELGKARAELKDAEARLRDAAKRLAELEAKTHGQMRYRVFTDRGPKGPQGGDVRVFRFDGHPVPPVPPVPPMPPGAHAGPDNVRFFTAPNPETDKRIKELEQKLDRVLDELKELKKSRGGEGQARVS